MQSRQKRLAVEQTSDNLTQRAAYRQRDLLDEHVPHFAPPRLASASHGESRTAAHSFTFLVLGDQNAGKSTLLHSFCDDKDPKHMALTSFLPILNASFLNMRLRAAQLHLGASGQSEPHTGGSQGEPGGTAASSREPPFLDTDVAVGSFVMTRENFFFFLEEFGCDARSLELPSSAAFVCVRLVELGGHHLDLLMLSPEAAARLPALVQAARQNTLQLAAKGRCAMYMADCCSLLRPYSQKAAATEQVSGKVGHSNQTGKEEEEGEEEEEARACAGFNILELDMGHAQLLLSRLLFASNQLLSTHTAPTPAAAPFPVTSGPASTAPEEHELKAHRAAARPAAPPPLLTFLSRLAKAAGAFRGGLGGGGGGAGRPYYLSVARTIEQLSEATAMQAVQREMDGDARPHIGEVDVAESFNRAMAVALRRGGDRKGGEVGVEERGDGWEDLQQQEKLDWESEGCVEEKGVGGEGHAKETQKGLVPLLAGVQAALSVLMALSSSSPLFLDPSSSSPSVPSSHSIASSAPDSSDFSSNITIRVHRCEVISAQGRLRPYEVVRVVARLFAHQMQHSAGTSTAHTAKLLLDCFKQPLLRLQSDKDFHLYLTQEVFAEYMEEREDSIAGDSSQLPAACHADEFIATAEALAACNFALLNRRQHSLQIWQRFAPATTFSLQLRRGPSLSVTSHAGQATQHAWPTLFHRKRNSFPVARPSLPSLESHESMKARELQLCVRFPYDSDLLQLVEQLMEQNCHMLSPGALAPVPPPALVDRMRCRLDEVQSLLTQRLQHSFDRIFRSAAATVPHPSSAQDTAQNILPCPVSSSPTPSPLSPSSTAVDFIVRLEDLALCRRLRAALHIEDSRKAEDISLPLPSWLGNETEGGEPVLGPAETWKAVAEMLAPLAVAFVPKSWPAESAAGKAREWGNEGSGAWAVDVRFG